MNPTIVAVSCVLQQRERRIGGLHRFRQGGGGVDDMIHLAVTQMDLIFEVNQIFCRAGDLLYTAHHTALLSPRQQSASRTMTVLPGRSVVEPPHIAPARSEPPAAE